MSEYFASHTGDRMYVDEYGGVAADDRRPVLVALHGLGGGGYFFAGLGRSQAERGRRVICPDLPGSGLSPRGDRPVTLDRCVDAVVGLIERRAGATVEPVALMGHSIGTIIALKVYARIPDRIRSLIFVGGLPVALPEARARLRDRAALARSAGMGAVAPAVVPVVFSRRSLDAIPDKVAMFERLLAGSDPEGYAQTATALADADAADVVARVRVPCLCVTGAKDRYAPPASVGPFARAIPGAQYRELPDCGHMPFFEAPEAFNRAVDDFESGFG